MATKRIRCVCGIIYDSTTHSVCPVCQTTPPSFEKPNVSPPEPLPPFSFHQINNLDSDRKKRPWLYFRLGHPLLTPKKIALAGGLIVLLAGVWFLFRPTSQPLPPEVRKNLVSKDSPAPAPSPVEIVKISPSSDLAAAIAQAAPGSTLQLAPGTYRGSFMIDKALHLLGENSGGQVIVQNDPATRFSVQAAEVILENLTITGNEGDPSAIRVLKKGSLELRNCVIDTPGSVGVSIIQGSKLVASKTTFSTRGKGSGCQLEDASSGSLSACIFKNNQWGYSVLTGSEGIALECHFEQNGTPSGLGTCLTAEGGKSYLIWPRKHGHG